MGYDADDYMWHDARAWGKIEFFDHEGGHWRYADYKINSRIKIHGAVYAETCAGSRIAVFKDSGIVKKKVTHKFMWKLDDINFRIRNDDDLYCDFEVFRYGDFNNPDASLYNRRYSDL